jgi:hypothetical protein
MVSPPEELAQNSTLCGRTEANNETIRLIGSLFFSSD